jgi:hypothetical protein
MKVSFATLRINMPLTSNLDLDFGPTVLGIKDFSIKISASEYALGTFKRALHLGARNRALASLLPASTCFAWSFSRRGIFYSTVDDLKDEIGRHRPLRK